MKRKISAVFSVLVLASLVFFAGCSESEFAKGDSGSSEKDKDSGTFVIGSNADVLTSLDRFANFGWGGDDNGNIWGDPLVSNDHHGNYEPALAVEWEPSEDYLQWKFILRDNVSFSDGTKFTSADVKKTYERLHEDKTLVDVNAWGNFDYVETPDEKTAIIHLTGIMPTFLDEVGRVPVICASAFNADPRNYFYSPAGTGAYYVTSFDKQTGEIQYAKNRDWWGWTEANKNTVDKIVYKFILEDTTRASALKSGDIDFATQLTLDYLKDLDEEEYNLNTVTMDTHMHVVYQCGPDSWFRNRDLREALSLSIDRELIVKNILGGGDVSNWPIPEGNLGYVPGHEYEYDLDKAKAMVEASGYNGEELTMILTTSSFLRASEVAQAIQSMAAEAGFNIKVETLEHASFTDRRSAGAFDLILGSFASTCGDPQVEVAVIIAFNVFGANYDNEEMHNLAVSCHNIADKKEREEVLKKVFAIEMEEFAPFAYLYSPETLYAMKKHVTGVTSYADGSSNFKFVKFAE